MAPAAPEPCHQQLRPDFCPNRPGRRENVPQRRDGFVITASLQPAVGVDSQSRRGDALNGPLQHRLDFLVARPSRSVTTTDPRADAVMETNPLEVINTIHPAAGSLNRGDIRVEMRNSVDNDTELGVAQVRVNLRRRGCTTTREPE